MKFGVVVVQMSKIGFTAFLFSCSAFGWGFAALMSIPAYI
jgi:hypothetical protein